MCQVGAEAGKKWFWTKSSTAAVTNKSKIQGRLGHSHKSPPTKEKLRPNSTERERLQTNAHDIIDDGLTKTRKDYG